MGVGVLVDEWVWIGLESEWKNEWDSELESWLEIWWDIWFAIGWEIWFAIEWEIWRKSVYWHECDECTIDDIIILN